jgi:hypothetical protein
LEAKYLGRRNNGSFAAGFNIMENKPQSRPIDAPLDERTEQRFIPADQGASQQFEQQTASASIDIESLIQKVEAALEAKVAEMRSLVDTGMFEVQPDSSSEKPQQNVYFDLLPQIEEAKSLANQALEKAQSLSKDTQDGIEELEINPHDTLRRANEMGREGNDEIRFELQADGTYQQFVNGRKGETFTQEELKEAIHGRNTDGEETTTGDAGIPVALSRQLRVYIAGLDPFFIWDKCSAQGGNFLSLKCTVSSLQITGSSFVNEFAPGSLGDMMEFDGNNNQTSFTMPLAERVSALGNSWVPVTEGGVYTINTFCVNGKPAIYPVKVV